jgi:hypothetical protein
MSRNTRFNKNRFKESYGGQIIKYLGVLRINCIRSSLKPILKIIRQYKDFIKRNI